MVRPTTDTSSLISSSYKEVIGYNEPDVSGSAVDVKNAVSKWPAVVVQHPPTRNWSRKYWFYDFISGIEAKGSHVDLICLHHFLPTGSVSNFPSYIEGVYNM